MKENIEEIGKDLKRISKQLENKELAWQVRLFHYKKAAECIEMLGGMVNTGAVKIKDIPGDVISGLTYIKLADEITASDILIKAMEMYDISGDAKSAVEVAIKYRISGPEDLVRRVFDRVIDLAFQLNDQDSEYRFSSERQKLLRSKKSEEK